MEKDNLLSVLRKHLKRSKLEEEKSVGSAQKNYAKGKKVAYKYCIKKIEELEK